MTSTSRHNDVDSGIGDNSDNNNNINSSYQQQQATKETERMSAKNILPGSSFQDMGPSTMLGMLGIGSTSPILKMAYNINLQQQQQQQRDNAIVFAKINKDSLSTRTSTGTSIENRNKKKRLLRYQAIIATPIRRTRIMNSKRQYQNQKRLLLHLLSLPRKT